MLTSPLPLPPPHLSPSLPLLAAHRSAVLEIVVSYLEWFEKYSDAPEGTRIPDFEKGIPADLALELHMTADFLDV